MYIHNAENDTVGGLIRLLSHWSPNTQIKVVLSDEFPKASPEELPPPDFDEVMALEITAGCYDEMNTLYLLLE